MIDPKISGARASYCRKCWGPHYQKIDDERLERADLIEDYDGPVCIGDKYYQSVEDCIDSYECLGADEPPEFAHTCTVHHYQLDAIDILQDLVENANAEQDVDRLSGVKEFEAAVADFNAANGGPGSTEYWHEDTKHKCRIRPIDAEAGKVQP